jgi:O-acetyl-ADP-ribose deacetylase (regulator of RNase III)
MSAEKISVVRASLLDAEVDVIVNAANTLMRGGGGIDGAIHQRAGYKMLLELQRVAPKGCETGEVVVTLGFDLPQKWVIHTPGPIWRGGTNGEQELLAQCYRNSMLKGIELGAKSIGFCSISTGVYNFPIELAADIALQTVLPLSDGFEQVVFAMFGAREYEVFNNSLARL